MNIKRVKLSDATKKKGKSREELLEDMSEEELHRRATADLDNPPLTDEQLKEFSIAQQKEKRDEKS
ncbi:hypothetical protein MNBD_GAMMA17-1435 [hydrothermal vent metagenome]|uniref:Uncharacterized protein n=1 Tax=hydrothermal vent metagenome TaxID=652676 RepID=A0A3B0ZWU5_9ZZZZ